MYNRWLKNHLHPVPHFIFKKTVCCACVLLRTSLFRPCSIYCHLFSVHSYFIFNAISLAESDCFFFEVLVRCWHDLAQLRWMLLYVLHKWRSDMPPLGEFY
ncbi:hypothetical protein STCU_12218 [Strigomonas culicis]|uniref:Uncharacterized protein n=1 Tax=Strigomonas culicis TaxID=28005 RepID=S9TE47_9TRYP|nr:hypothetical protein STCU_12218 [Strigomonas culicis]|eukprot:EPY15234.1 hypothetical protein STCU_12218 [Strigomonas culicis]